MGRVIVVDDDREIRETVRMVLEDVGHDVEDAEDGLTALQLLASSVQPAVVLLDLMMPRLDGEQMLALIAGDPLLSHSHAYIVMTASRHIDFAPLRELLTALAIPVLYKPFDVDVLLDLIDAQSARMGSRELSPHEVEPRKDVSTPVA